VGAVVERSVIGTAVVVQFWRMENHLLLDTREHHGKRSRVAKVIVPARTMVDLVATERRCFALERRELIRQARTIEKARASACENRQAIGVDCAAIAVAVAILDPVLGESIDDPLRGAATTATAAHNSRTRRFCGLRPPAIDPENWISSPGRAREPGSKSFL